MIKTFGAFAITGMALSLSAAALAEPAATAAAPAAQAQATASAAAATAQAPEEKKVCRMETGTGSVMPKRVCRTVAQVDEEQRRNAEAQVDRQSRRSVGSNGF